MTALGQGSVQPGSPSTVVYDAPPALVRAYTLRVTSVALDRVLDDAIVSDNRVPTFRLRVDWYGDGNYAQRYSDMTRMVKSLSFTQELATELPAVIGFVEGTAASKLQVTLGGQMLVDGILRPDGSYVEDVDTVRAFSPYGPSGPGPVINRALELRTGFLTPEGPVNLLRFTGTVTGYTPTASTREVVLDALDPVSRLRRTITQYAFGVDGVLLSRYGSFRYPFAINVQWFIDRILRANGYYASPPPGGLSESLVALSATMHGSNQHEIGSHTYIIDAAYVSSNPTSWTPPYEYGVSGDPAAPEAHPYQMMFPRQGYDYEQRWITRGTAAMRAGIDGWGMSGLIRIPAAGSTLTEYIWSFLPVDGFSMQLRLINGLPYAYVTYPNGSGGSAQGLYTLAGVSAGSVAKWLFCGVHFASETGGIRITMQFGDRSGSALVSIPVPSNLTYSLSARAVGRTIVPFTNFSIWYQPVAPAPTEWVGITWTPTAYVDPGLNWIGGMPDIIARESYDLIKEIVTSEFGTFYFDETGKPFFRSQIVNRGWNRPPELLTSEREISDLVMTVDDSGVRNVIEAETSVLVAGVWETVWEPDDPYYFTLPANQFNTWTLPLPENVVDVAETDDQIVKWVSSELWGNVDDNPYYYGKLVFSASLLSDPTVDVYSAVGAGKLATAKFVFYVRRIDARNVSVRIENYCPYGVRFATASKIGTNSATGTRDNNMVTEGDPAFRLPGRKIYEGASSTTTARHERSIYTYGLQSYDLGGKNVWRQTVNSAQVLSGLVMQYTAKPKPVLSQVEVPHNPRRRLRDKVIITEPDSFGARIWGTVYGISVQFDENGARDILTIRPDDPPPGW